MKRGLLREVDTVRNEYTACVVDETKEQKSVSICRRQPHQYELNSLSWSGIMLL